MKKWLCVMCALLLIGGALFASAAAEEAVDTEAVESASAADVDLSAFALEELLALRDRIDEEISQRGYSLYYDLQRGDKGEAVARLQERLRELGYYGGKISGKYDTETQKAMKQFEKRNGLENDGLASREDQAVLFSGEAVPKNPPQSAGDAGAQPEPTEPAEADPYADYGDFDYSEVFRYNEKHIGDKVKLVGKVVQVMGNRQSGFQIRLAINRNTDIVFVTIPEDPGYNILENDRLTVYGVVSGTITYQSIWNQTITIPSVNADAIILR